MTTQTKNMKQLWQDSYLAGDNDAYLEQLYENYLANPEEVDPKWRRYFDNLTQQMVRPVPDVAHTPIQEQFAEFARHSARTVVQTMEGAQDQQQERVIELIAAYRRLGHLQATTDPLALTGAIYNPTLELAYYGFSEQDMQRTFNVGSYTALGKPTATLNEIYQSLRKVYCGNLGMEYMHINRSDEVEWIRDRIEQGWVSFNPPVDVKKRILNRLVVADGLEKYLGFKYVGQKRFSLEGGDSLIPMLDGIVERSAQYGVHEAVIGMAHRGRLNVLVNIVGKDPKEIFAAFEGKGIRSTHSGDVKYHLGASATVATASGPIRMVLAFNPSHLEIVSPVVQGTVRARQRRRRDGEQKQVLPIQIHGDSAFAGQGVVMETFNMSQARWFTVGGSIHIVINNQVGFTTSNPKDTRSTTYCTDIAKMVEAPILHVNGNDPEAVYFAGLFAIDYRNTFKRDVVVDLVCYRRHGHNEADEPSATQPLMYKVIKAMPAPYQLYEKKLLDEKVLTESATKAIGDEYRDALDNGKSVLTLAQQDNAKEFTVNWQPFEGTHWDKKTDTSVPLKKLQALGAKLTDLPESFVMQPQVKKGYDAQKKMTAGELPLNWGFAENLAYATLLDQGYAVRLCGQDAGRGTFAHRHAVLYDQNTGMPYIPLSHISPSQAQINIVDSLLSEEAVLAFEYGYATAEPNFLVLWEAQFGDFANGAQVVIDQFISSGEQKWGSLSNLVMLLPHGYEGMGPEHSSARLERYLQLCAQDNIQVCVPSTPAQIFHLLRRQMVRPYRKPLIVMTPKSLLRNPEATSSLDDLSQGELQLIIPDTDQKDAKKMDSVIFCCGKVYYELRAHMREAKMNNVAIVRVEQLYPFPEAKMKELLKSYAHVKDFVWCQEEPENQGAWNFIQPFLNSLLGKDQKLRYAGRPASASPAAGYHSVHEKEQEKLITQALTK